MKHLHIADILADPTVRSWLDRLRRHHAESFHHSVRVANWSIRYAQRFRSYGEDDLRTLALGALFHDIGKLGVPAAILAKPGPLDEREWDQMRAHPRLGFDLTKDSLSEEVRRIIVGHHEYKPTPYPRESGRLDVRDDFLEIVAAADIYDALRYRRSYKGPLPAEEVRRHLVAQFLGNPSIPGEMVSVGSPN